MHTRELDLPAGTVVRDAGCNLAHVATRLQAHTKIADIVSINHHIAKA